MRTQSRLIFESTLSLLGSRDPQLYGTPDKLLDVRLAAPVNRFLSWLTPHGGQTVIAGELLRWKVMSCRVRRSNVVVIAMWFSSLRVSVGVVS